MLMTKNSQYQGREGFAFTSVIFGIVALVTWQWLQVGTLVSMMSVGFGIVGLRSTRKLVAVIGIILGTASLALSLTTAFLQWP
jgi:hypothetical protein